VNFLNIIKNIIFEWRDNKDINRYNRIMGGIEQERNPQQKLEKQVLLELRGTLLGGMASSTAYMGFKRNYFDKLENNSDKDKVKNVLMHVLRGSDFNFSDKIISAYACADIVILDAVPEIEKLIRLSKEGSIEEQVFNQSLEALKIGKSITDVIYDKLRQSGEM
jgi:hypothetical protein